MPAQPEVPKRDASRFEPSGAAARPEPPLPTGVSTSGPGAIEGDMDLDLVLRQDKRDFRAAIAVFRREERSEAKARYGDMMALVPSLGQCGRKIRREATSRLRAIVSEVYSAPSVTATAA